MRISNEPLTIAIPFYKGHAYLRAAIESVRKQSSPHWQLVVCDDGPDSGTAELLASFGDPRMRYLRNERNLGMASNWNRCLDAAETDLVNLLHNDDDYSHWLETMLRDTLTRGCPSLREHRRPGRHVFVRRLREVFLQPKPRG